MAEKSPSTERLFTKEFILVGIVNFAIFFGFQMLTVGMPVYIAQLGGNSMTVGLVTTLITLAALIIRPISGATLDKFGRKGILVVGTVVMLLAILSFAIFPVIGVILVMRFVQGIGWGMSSTATSTIAADCIPKTRFAEGMGWYSMTSAIAIAIAPALSVQLVQTIGSAPMITVSGVSITVGIVLSLFLKAKTPAKNPNAPAKPKGLSSIFESRAFLPTALQLLINFGSAAITTFLALHGQANGVANVSLYFIIYAVTTLVTRPFIGKFIDRHGFYVPGILATLTTVGTLVLIAYSHSLAMFCIAGVFAGLGLGTGMSVMQTMAVAAVEPQRRGVATSTFLFGFDAGIMAGSFIAGILASALGYKMTFVCIAAAPLIACIIILAIGRQRIQRYRVNQ